MSSRASPIPSTLSDRPSSPFLPSRRFPPVDFDPLPALPRASYSPFEPVLADVGAPRPVVRRVRPADVVVVRKGAAGGGEGTEELREAYLPAMREEGEVRPVVKVGAGRLELEDDGEISKSREEAKKSRKKEKKMARTVADTESEAVAQHTQSISAVERAMLSKEEPSTTAPTLPSPPQPWSLPISSPSVPTPHQPVSRLLYSQVVRS